MGGFSIKPNMEAIIYDPNEEYANNEGFIASLSQDVFNEIQDYISTEEFQNFTNLGSKVVEVKGNWSSQNSIYITNFFLSLHFFIFTICLFLNDFIDCERIEFIDRSDKKKLHLSYGYWE